MTKDDDWYKNLPEYIKEMLKIEDERCERFRALRNPPDHLKEFRERIENSRNFMENIVKSRMQMDRDAFDINNLIARYETLSMPPAGASIHDLEIMNEIFINKEYANLREKISPSYESVYNTIQELDKTYDKIIQTNYFTENLTDSLTEALEKSASFADDILKNYGKFKSPLWNEFLDVAQNIKRDRSAIQFSEGRITYYDEEVADVNEVSSIISSLFEDAQKISKKPVNILYLVFEKIKYLKISHVLKFILISILLHFFCNFTHGIFEPTINPIIYNVQKTLYGKAYKKIGEARVNYFLTDTSKKENARVVQVRRLNVRSKPNMKSPVINRLDGGAVIWLQDKRKKWSHVSWFSEGAENLGWVYNKHITKPKISYSSLSL